MQGKESILQEIDDVEYPIEDRLGCYSCKHFSRTAKNNPFADCPRRLEKYRFYKPVFASPYLQYYHICSEYQPEAGHIHVCKHWTGIDDYMIAYRALWLKPNQIVSYVDREEGEKGWVYQVGFEDFYSGNLLDENGNLRWRKRWRTKKSRKSPVGYKREIEDNVLVHK